MESKVKEAVQRKMCGYNCAQAVACTYCEQAGLDEETVKNLTQGFAVGMGGSMEATCGAIIGTPDNRCLWRRGIYQTGMAAAECGWHTPDRAV